MCTFLLCCYPVAKNLVEGSIRQLSKLSIVTQVKKHTSRHPRCIYVNGCKLLTEVTQKLALTFESRKAKPKIFFQDDRHWSEHRSHDRYRDDRDYHRRDYREEPSEIVMLKGLASTVEDTQVRNNFIIIHFTVFLILIRLTYLQIAAYEYIGLLQITSAIPKGLLSRYGIPGLCYCFHSVLFFQKLKIM